MVKMNNKFSTNKQCFPETDSDIMAPDPIKL